MSSTSHSGTTSSTSNELDEKDVFIPEPTIDTSIRLTHDEYVRTDEYKRFVITATTQSVIEYTKINIEVYRNLKTGEYYISKSGMSNTDVYVLFNEGLHEGVSRNDSYSGTCYVVNYDDEKLESITSILYQYPDAVCNFEYTPPEKIIHSRLVEQGTVNNVDLYVDYLFSDENTLLHDVQQEPLYFVEQEYDHAVDYRVIDCTLYRHKETGEYYLNGDGEMIDTCVTVFNDDEACFKHDEQTGIDMLHYYDGDTTETCRPVSAIVNEYDVDHVLLDNNGIGKVEQ